MSDFAFHDIFPHGADAAPYRKLTGDHVGAAEFAGARMVTVAPEALTLLARQAFIDSQHLLRPGHLAQLRAILDDSEASANDKFVALDLLKNANIAAGKVLPMCQDTGTAIVMAKKGQQVWTGADDAAAISSFADPSVNFMLEFAGPPIAQDIAKLPAAVPAPPEQAETEPKPTGQVVSIDRFRKR